MRPPLGSKESKQDVLMKRYAIRPTGRHHDWFGSDTKVEADDDGSAFLLFDGIRMLRALTLGELLAQVRVAPRELEAEFATAANASPRPGYAAHNTTAEGRN
jgi:hypothetical protein